jgi:hypothetical protein
MTKADYKKCLLFVLDWARKLFFACVFATLVSFWSAKWEETHEKIIICESRAPAAKTLEHFKYRR